MTLSLPGAGTAVATATRRIHTTHATVTEPQTVTLSIVPTRALARRLHAHHRQRVTITVAYTPGGGQPIAERDQIQLAWR